MIRHFLSRSARRLTQRSQVAPQFRFRDSELPLFLHHYNCGWPGRRMTERAIELALADHWLTHVTDEVIEIGAVTPYYWPGRIADVADPTDTHRRVSIPKPFDQIDASGRSVLSISTFEHIGYCEYGLDANPGMLAEAFAKLFAESPCFLVTVPTGYNGHCDAFVLADLPADVQRTVLCRGAWGNRWQEVDQPTARQLRYGHGSRLRSSGWANGLVVLTRRWPSGQGRATRQPAAAAACAA